MFVDREGNRVSYEAPTLDQMLVAWTRPLPGSVEAETLIEVIKEVTGNTPEGGADTKFCTVVSYTQEKEVLEKTGAKLGRAPRRCSKPDEYRATIADVAESYFEVRS